MRAQSATALLRTWFQPFCVIILLLGMYTLFLGWHLLPQLQYVHNNSGGFLTTSVEPSFSVFISDNKVVRTNLTALLFIFMLFHLALLGFLTSFVRAAVTDPGTVPVKSMEDRKKWQDGIFDITPEDDEKIEALILDYEADLTDYEVTNFIQNSILVERKKEGDASQYSKGMKRQCRKCYDIYKPDRTHHCKVCGVCILRMDHHCPWLATCIGFHNYKYFMLSLFYAAICCMIMIAWCGARFARVFQPVYSWSVWFRQDFPVALHFVIASMFCIGLTGFCTFHIWMVCNALTSIERIEKKNHTAPDIQHRWKIAHIKFDQGYWKNFLHVMGPPSMWLIPVEPNSKDDGTYSHVNWNETTKEK